MRGASLSGSRDARRGDDSTASRRAAWGDARAREAVHQGRGAEPDQLVQGARTVGRGDHGKGARRRTIALPTAGNAGGAAAAYAARAGLNCVVAMPSDTPVAIVLECRAFGADVSLIDGLISDCGCSSPNRPHSHGWYECRPEGAVPHRRQEDDGVRVVGGVRR